MNPKFTLITHDYPPAHGGIARYLSSLVAASNGGIEVRVPTGHSSCVARHAPDSATGDVKEVKFWSVTWPKWSPLIKRCMEVPDEQIILVSHVFPIGTAAFIANALGGPEYAIIFHGTDLKRVKTRWKRWLLRRICNNARSLIVNSQATKKQLSRLVPNSSPLVLTPGLEPYNLPDKRSSREAFNIPPETKVILAVSRLVERKGIDTLIQAIAEIELKDENSELGMKPSEFRIQNSEFLLVVVGDGNYAKTLHQLAELSGVNVRWEGNVDDQTLYSWYAAADIFCLPGREVADDIEGFGMVFLEAAYAGLPVIAGESGGAREAIVHNETGLLIEPTVEACTTAIAKLLNDSELAHRFGKAGYSRAVQSFNWADRWNQLQSNVQTVVRKERTMQINNQDHKRENLSISVVIPCCNHAEELKGTLESLVNQTVGVKEVIVVDDASQDNPLQTAEQFKEQLPLTLIRLETNQGAPKARNTGFAQVTSEYVMFLDSDAKLEDDALEKLHQALLASPSASYAYCNFLWGGRLFRGREFDPVELKKMNYIHTSALIKTKDFEHFDESLKKFQDWDLWLTMLQSGKQGVWVPLTLMKIKERKNGISSWLPSFIYKIPWPILGFTPNAIIKYRKAERIIREKHNLAAS